MCAILYCTYLSQNHRITEWPGLEGTSRIMNLLPIPFHVPTATVSFIFISKSNGSNLVLVYTDFNESECSKPVL